MALHVIIMVFHEYIGGFCSSQQRIFSFHQRNKFFPSAEQASYWPKHHPLAADVPTFIWLIDVVIVGVTFKMCSYFVKWKHPQSRNKYSIFSASHLSIKVVSFMKSFTNLLSHAPYFRRTISNVGNGKWRSFLCNFAGLGMALTIT